MDLVTFTEKILNVKLHFLCSEFCGDRYWNRSEEDKKIKATHEKSNLFQPAITCSNLTIETLEKGVKYVQS